MRACVTSPEVIQETALCVRVKIRLACVFFFIFFSTIQMFLEYSYSTAISP